MNQKLRHKKRIHRDKMKPTGIYGVSWAHLLGNNGIHRTKWTKNPDITG